MPHADRYTAHLALVQAGLDAVRDGQIITMELRDLAPTGTPAWAVTSTPVTMTSTFPSEWAALPETDRRSALIRLTAINRDVWHPSLIVTHHTSQVMSATATTGAVLFFTSREGERTFLAVAGSTPA